MHIRKKDIDHNSIPVENQVSADQEHLKSCGYFALFEQATDAIMVTDLNGNFIDVNSSLCTMIGYTKNELLGRNVSEFIDPENLKETPIPFDLLLQGKNTFTERKAVHKDGSIVYLDSNAKKCGDNEILVIARNITERKKTERILQKSEANLQTILNNTDTVYVLLDRHLRIISYNARARAFAEKELGHNFEISEYFLDYFSTEKRPVLLSYMKAALTGRHIHYEVSYPQPGNVSNRYNVKLFPISNGDNNVYGIVMAVADITEKANLEEKLEEERIKKQQEITDAVITAEENERHEIGQELHDNVNQLLATSRLYIGIAKQRIGKKNYDLLTEADTFINTAIKEIRSLSHSLISPFIDEYGLTEAIDHLTGSIPAGNMLPVDKEINIAENTIEEKLKLTIYRIIQEQLNNILKYAKATSVKIKLVQDNENIILSIKDNGVGFNPAKTSKGIGLMNIRTRVSLFNGKLDIISSPGNGCELVINFTTAATG